MGNPPYDHCPKCGLKSDRTWLSLYTGPVTTSDAHGAGTARDTGNGLKRPPAVHDK